MACYPITFSLRINKPCVGGMGGLRAVYIAAFNSHWNKSTAQFGQTIDVNGETSAVSFVPGKWTGNRFSGYWGVDANDIQLFDGGAIYEALMDAAPFTYVKFHKIDLARTGAKIQSTYQPNEDNNSGYFENVLTIPLAGITTEAVNVISGLLGYDVFAVAADNAGHLIPLGLEEPARIIAATLDTGADPGTRPGEQFQIRCYSETMLPVELIESSYESGVPETESSTFNQTMFEDVFL